MSLRKREEEILDNGDDEENEEKFDSVGNRKLRNRFSREPSEELVRRSSSLNFHQSFIYSNICTLLFVAGNG